MLLVRADARVQMLLYCGRVQDCNTQVSECPQLAALVGGCTGSNVISVAEDVVMRMLVLMRNFVPAFLQTIHGEWNVAQVIPFFLFFFFFPEFPGLLTLIVKVDPSC